jgi:hypothetical protein
MDGADHNAEVMNMKGTDAAHTTRPPKPRQISRFDHSPSVNNFYLTLPTGLDSNVSGGLLAGSRARTPTNMRNSGGSIGLDQFGRKFAFNRKSAESLELQSI